MEKVEKEIRRKAKYIPMWRGKWEEVCPFCYMLNRIYDGEYHLEDLYCKHLAMVEGDYFIFRSGFLNYSVPTTFFKKLKWEIRRFFNRILKRGRGR